MRWDRTTKLGLLVGACLILPACRVSGPSAPVGVTRESELPRDATTTSAAVDSSSEALREHHRHEHGGVVTFVTMSLDTLGLSPEKHAQIDEVRADLDAKLAPVRSAERNLKATLAAGVASGNVDAARVDAALAQLWAASTGVQAAATADALNQIHAILSPEERQVLAEKIEAHWDVYRQVNASEDPGSHARGSRLERLRTELSLTNAQVDRITAALASSRDARAPTDVQLMDAHVHALADAFATPTFDAKRFAVPQASPDVAKLGATRMAHFYEAVTPVLTPGQRATLAAKLRRFAAPDK